MTLRMFVLLRSVSFVLARAMRTQSFLLAGLLIAALAFPLLARSVPVAAPSVQHPMDPLSWDEHWTVIEVLKASEHADKDTEYWLVILDEPPKSEVLAWKPDDEIPRSAFVVVRQGDRVYEAIVDLVSRELTSWRELEDVILPLSDEEEEDEEEAIKELVKENADWQAAMKRRGITDFSDVDCWARLLGYFGTPLQLEGRRVARVNCELEVRLARYFPGPAGVISGLTVLVDIEKREVIEVLDEDAAPILQEDGDHDAQIGRYRDVPTPISLEQPLGPSFEVNGHSVSWQNWTFHFRVDPRVGLMVSTVRYRDGEKSRSILYQGSLSEIFVPYMDPASPWFDFNFFDTGGSRFAVPLAQGSDCPDNAIYFDALVASRSDGKPETITRSACLFERYAGDMAWRHRYGDRRPVESRAKRDLVLRMVARLGNYEYFVDWVFQQDATIQVRVGATGTDNVKLVSAPMALAEFATDGDNGGDETARADAYGRFVDENVVAVNHDHFFSFRLDLDVDGPRNSFLREQLKTMRLDHNHPRKSLWVVEPHIAQVEDEAKLNIDFERPSLWRVINPDVRNHVGYPVSYQIYTRANLMSLLDRGDYPQQRGGFTEYHLWVTPYHPDELYVAGLYPAFGKGGDGLPKWTAANRSIVKTDIVVWYTFGMHHVPRAEDWPVMPTAWHSFEIRPFNFFDQNPALDLPKHP